MAFTDALLAEFDHEMQTTRNLLERVPFEKAAWKPHDKSSGFAALASHLVQLAGFGDAIATKTELNLAPSGERYTPVVYATPTELLEAFDTNVRKGREAISALQDEQLGTPWTLKAGEHTIFTMPRAAVLRSLMMNHIIHHRGQLSVYLRLNDVPLPSIYGPTADS